MIVIILWGGMPVLSDSEKQLLNASRCGDRVKIQALLDRGVKVDARLQDGTTALYQAVYYGMNDCAKALLAAGANTELGYDGRTPLMAAAEKGNLEMVESLVKQGANSFAVLSRRSNMQLCNDRKINTSLLNAMMANDQFSSQIVDHSYDMRRLSHLVYHADLNGLDCKKLLARLLPEAQKVSIKNGSVIFGALSALLAHLPKLRLPPGKLLKGSVPYKVVKGTSRRKGVLVKKIIGNDTALKAAMTDKGTYLYAIFHTSRHWWAKPKETRGYLGQIAAAYQTQQAKRMLSAPPSYKEVVLEHPLRPSTPLQSDEGRQVETIVMGQSVEIVDEKGELPASLSITVAAGAGAGAVEPKQDEMLSLKELKAALLNVPTYSVGLFSERSNQPAALREPEVKAVSDGEGRLVMA